MTPTKPRTAPDPTELLAAQLMASRDMLLATVTQIDTALFALGVDVNTEADADGCAHPKEHVVSTAKTLGDPEGYRCTLCNATSDTPFDHADAPVTFSHEE